MFGHLYRMQVTSYGAVLKQFGVKIQHGTVMVNLSGITLYTSSTQ